MSRTVSGATTFSVWDGWDLIEEYQAGSGGFMFGVDVFELCRQRFFGATKSRLGRNVNSRFCVYGIRGVP